MIVSSSDNVLLFNMNFTGDFFKKSKISLVTSRIYFIIDRITFLGYFFNLMLETQLSIFFIYIFLIAFTGYSTVSDHRFRLKCHW